MGLDKFWQKVLTETDFTTLRWGDSYLVSRASLKGFIQWSMKERKIIGLEGFTFDGENFTPLMECIADFSDGVDDAAFLKILSTDDWQKPHFVEIIFAN